MEKSKEGGRDERRNGREGVQIGGRRKEGRSKKEGKGREGGADRR